MFSVIGEGHYESRIEEQLETKKKSAPKRSVAEQPKSSAKAKKKKVEYKEDSSEEEDESEDDEPVYVPRKRTAPGSRDRSRDIAKRTKVAARIGKKAKKGRK